MTTKKHFLLLLLAMQLISTTPLVTNKETHPSGRSSENTSPNNEIAKCLCVTAFIAVNVAGAAVLCVLMGCCDKPEKPTKAPTRYPAPSITTLPPHTTKMPNSTVNATHESRTISRTISPNRTASKKQD